MSVFNIKSEMLWSLSFFLLSLLASLRLFYISFVYVSHLAFLHLCLLCFHLPSLHHLIVSSASAHKHFTSPPLFLSPLSPSVFPSLPLSVFLCVLILRGRRLICVLLSAVTLCRWLPAVNSSGLFHTDTRLSSSHHPLCQSHTPPLITICFIRETVRQS